MYAVYDRIFDDFPAENTVYTLYMTVYLVIFLPKIRYVYTVYDRLFDEPPAKNTVYTPYIYTIGQNRIYAPYMTVYLVTSLPKTPYILGCIYGSGLPVI